MQRGLTLPNVAFRLYSAAELAALDDLQPSVVLVLLYGGAIDQTHLQQLRPYIDKHHPRLLYRPFAGNIPTWTPRAWASECRHRIQGLPPGELVPDNERNLPSESGNNGWGAHITWLTAFVGIWRSFNLNTPVHLSALSPIPGYEYGLMAYVEAGLPTLFDVADFHCYASEHLASAKIVAGSIGKPSMITEFNQIPSSTIAQETWAKGGVYFLLGGTDDQAQYDILKNPAAYQSFKTWKEVPLAPQDFTSPNHEGSRASTLGVVIHATLSDTATAQTEFDGTVSWFNSPLSEVSAHAVVGPGGVVWKPVHTDEIAWHCRLSNARWLGIELCKPRVGDPIQPDILDAAAKVVAGWCHDWEIPLVWSTTHGLAEHREMPTNTDGHQDVGGPFDRADFLARVKQYAGESVLTADQKKAVLDHLGVIWGESKADTIKQNPAESERAIHERVIAIKEVLGVNK
jgi:hypothetical protein